MTDTKIQLRGRALMELPTERFERMEYLDWSCCGCAHFDLMYGEDQGEQPFCGIPDSKSMQECRRWKQWLLEEWKDE